jgi:hypothetical protein
VRPLATAGGVLAHNDGIEKLGSSISRQRR